MYMRHVIYISFFLLLIYCILYVSILITSSVGGEGALPDFLFDYFFPVQQTTSGIGHRVK